MGRLRKKLNSRRGASILIALLFLLGCMMVAASILMAAASNAGKLKSNRVEQQKYLTLSSAIRLVCDELERAQYKGKYKVYEWKETIVTKTKEIDASGNEQYVQTEETKNYFYCAQTASQPNVDFTCGDLTAQLPMSHELDAIFAEQFQDSGGNNKKGYKALDSVNSSTETRILTVTLPDNLEDYPYGDPDEPYTVPKEVTVKVTLNHGTKTVKVTAWLGTEPDPPPGIVLNAELLMKNQPTLNYDPNHDSVPRTAGEGAYDSGVALVNDGTVTQTRTIDPSGEPEPAESSTDPVTSWKLNWIQKGGG